MYFKRSTAAWCSPLHPDLLSKISRWKDALALGIVKICYFLNLELLSKISRWKDALALGIVMFLVSKKNKLLPLHPDLLAKISRWKVALALPIVMFLICKICYFLNPDLLAISSWKDAHAWYVLISKKITSSLPGHACQDLKLKWHKCTCYVISFNISKLTIVFRLLHPDFPELASLPHLELTSARSSNYNFSPFDRAGQHLLTKHVGR